MWNFLEAHGHKFIPKRKGSHDGSLHWSLLLLRSAQVLFMFFFFPEHWPGTLPRHLSLKTSQEACSQRVLMLPGIPLFTCILYSNLWWFYFSLWVESVACGENLLVQTGSLHSFAHLKPLANFYLFRWHMHLCACVCAHVHTTRCVYAYQRKAPTIFLYHSLPYFPQIWPLLKAVTRLATNRSLWCKSWVTEMYYNTWLFIWALRIQTQILILV